MTAFGFLDRLIDIPPRHRRHAVKTAARLLLKLGHRIVVDLHANQSQFGIEGSGALCAKAQQVRIHDLSPDALAIHKLETSLDVVRARVNVFQRVAEEFNSARLFAFALYAAYRRDRTQDGISIDGPLAVVVDGFDLRNPVLPFGGSPVGPQGVGFAQMGIDVDYLDAGK